MREIKRKTACLRTALIALMAIAVALHIYGAWCWRDTPNSDVGIVALMAKHIVEGRDFPTFFYGQSYMGSFEPAVSALFCLLFGANNFSVCLGTVLVGLACLPIIYFWGKDAEDSTAGLAALAWCVIGPSGYFHYTCSPRGGYAATITLGAAILWLGGRIIENELAGKKNGAGRFFALGLLAGLGWWSSQLITAAILTAGLLFLIMLRARAFTWRIAPGTLGFLVGSFPFWLWNALNGWDTFSFMESFGKTRLLEGLKLFFVDRFLSLMDLNGACALYQNLAVVVYAGFLGGAVVILMAGIRRRSDTAARRSSSPTDIEAPKFRYVHLLSAIMFILISALLFSRSHFAHFDTARYLLPIVPALGVIVGVCASFLVRKTRYGIGWLPLILLVGWQVHTLDDLESIRKANESKRREAIETVGFLRDNGIKAAYCNYSEHWFNFALGEEFCFACLPPYERYAPYAQAAEIADEFAVAEHCENFNGLLARSGGAARCQAGFYFDFHPPTNGLKELPPERWAAVQDSAGSNIINDVSDRNLDSFWQASIKKSDEERLEIRFRNPATVCAVRMVSTDWYYRWPARYLIEGRREPDGAWQALTDVLEHTYYYWSGPRPYWAGDNFQFDVRFAPVQVTALRMRTPAAARASDWQVNEIEVFQPAPALVPEREAMPDLLRLIAERGIRCLYSERWAANAVYRETGGRVQTLREPWVFKSQDDALPVAVRLAPETALLLRMESAPICRDCLAKSEISMRETEIGPWILFDFEPGQWREQYRHDLGLVWNGFSCFLTDNKRWAAALAHRAESAYKHGEIPHAIALARKALDHYSNYQPALEKLAGWLKESGCVEEAEQLAKLSSTMWKPEIPARIGFKNGVEFLGLAGLPQTARPGASFAMSYYWLCPPEIVTTPLVAFVHFKGETGLFQDDHVFLDDMDTSFQPYPKEVFVEKRTVRIPADAPAGLYNMLLGLYDRSPPRERLRVRTGLPERHNAVILPVMLEIKGAM